MGSGTAFIVGATGSNGGSGCRGGLHMVDIRNPLNPTFLGCFSQDGYTHDAQCVIYDRGPDMTYRGKEICFCYNEDSLTIVDVTQKSNPKKLGKVGYAGSRYTHQGWLDDQHRFAFANDELDEMHGNNKHTKTLIFNVADLNNPRYVNSYRSPEEAIDHNLYVKNGYVYQANYCAGLRVLKIGPGSMPKLEEFASFDVEPTCNRAQFSGAWSVYPYFPSGNIIVSSIPRGLFVLGHQNSPTETPTPEPTTTPPNPECTDLHKKCPNKWKNKCWKPQVLSLCPLTCGTCNGGATTTIQNVCEDAHVKCTGKWKDRCHREKVQRLCPLTCGICTATL